MRIATILAAVLVFVGGGMHSLKVARHPDEIERYRRQAVGSVSSRQMVRVKIIGVASISVGLWLLVAAIAFRGHVISWVVVALTMAATFGLVVLVTRRLRLL